MAHLWIHSSSEGWAVLPLAADQFTLVSDGQARSQIVTGEQTPISKLRGTWHEYRGIPVMPTFHPAYLLRNYSYDNRRAVQDDMKKVLKYLETH